MALAGGCHCGRWHAGAGAADAGAGKHAGGPCVLAAQRRGGADGAAGVGGFPRERRPPCGPGHAGDRGRRAGAGLARRGTLHTRIRDGRVGAVARAGSHRGVPGLGGGQQPDAQGVAVGCLADRHAQGAGGWGHQPGDCTCAGCPLARSTAGGGRGPAGVFLLWRQPNPVRGGLAPPGHGAHGGLFFSGTFPGGGAGRGLAR